MRIRRQKGTFNSYLSLSGAWWECVCLVGYVDIGVRALESCLGILIWYYFAVFTIFASVISMLW